MLAFGFYEIYGSFSNHVEAGGGTETDADGFKSYEQKYKHNAKLWS